MKRSTPPSLLRSLRVALPTLIALLSLDLTASGQDAASATSMYRGGPSHTGVYDVPATHGYQGLRWRFQTRGPVISTPACKGDTIFVGSSDGNLYAIDAKTGREIWRRGTTGSVNSSPAVWKSSVIFQSSDGAIRSLRTSDGSVRWEIQSAATLPFPWGYESGDIYSSSPAVVDNTVVVGSGDGGVYRIDAATGRLIWRFQTDGRVRASPAVSGGIVYVGSADGYLYAIDLAAGTQQWKFATEGTTLFSGDFGFDRRTIQSSAAVTDGTVLFGARDGYLYALSASDGTERWRFNHEVSWVISSPAVADGVVFAGSSDGRFVQAVDVSTGNELWRKPTSSAWFSPVIAGEVVYFGDAAGTLHALNRTTGEYAWKQRFSGSLRGSALLTEDLIVFGGGDGGVYAVVAGVDRPFHRAVYWDEKLAEDAIFRGGEAVRDYFDDYELLDAGALTNFMRMRVADREPSVIVAAIDTLPQAVTDGSANSLLRQYMATGGKLVWLGEPPLLWSKDPESGDYAIDRIDRQRATDLLSVNHDTGNFDRLGVQATKVGLATGLEPWGTGAWSVDPSTVTTVLSYDEFGNAASWIKNYGGPAGTGFVRLWGQRQPIPNLTFVRTAAELRQ